MTKFLNAGLFGIALVAAAPALRAERITVVEVGGFDTGNARGMAKLERRLASAIETVCGSYSGASTSEEYEIRACRREAKAGIARQLVQLRASRADRLAGVDAPSGMGGSARPSGQAKK